MIVEWWIRDGSHDARGALDLRGVRGVGGRGESERLSVELLVEAGVVGGVSRKKRGSGSPFIGIDTCSS